MGPVGQPVRGQLDFLMHGTGEVDKATAAQLLANAAAELKRAHDFLSGVSTDQLPYKLKVEEEPPKSRL